MRMKAAIFADGNPCSAALRKILREGRFTIVLDGAAEAVRKQGWLPNLIAGDFDAVSKTTLRYFEKKGVTLLYAPDQNHTDLEKALAWCILRDAESVWITQALGGRADHTLANFSLLRRFHSKRHEILLFQDDEKIRFISNESLKLRGKRRRRIALLPYPECTARSKGLTYELKSLRLELGVNESVSNRAEGAVVRLAVAGSALLVEAF